MSEYLAEVEGGFGQGRVSTLASSVKEAETKKREQARAKTIRRAPDEENAKDFDRRTRQYATGIQFYEASTGGIANRCLPATSLCSVLLKSVATSNVRFLSLGGVWDWNLRIEKSGHS